MKSIRFTAILLAFVVLVGCGKQYSQTATGPIDLTGTWKIVLANNQAGRFTSVPPGVYTEIALSIYKQANGKYQLEPNTHPWDYDAACGPTGGPAWYSQGAWEWHVNLTSGSVTGSQVSLEFHEDSSFPQSGDLILSGTVRDDGTVDGTYSDSCSGVISPITWLAKRISTLPNYGDVQP